MGVTLVETVIRHDSAMFLLPYVCAIAPLKGQSDALFADMTIDRWIALASSVGTVIATAIAAISIRELRRQSAHQYRPNVILTNAMFEVSTDEEIGWWWKKPGEKASRFKDSTDYHLTLLNVGNGTAVDLDVEWSFDIHRIIKVINGLSIKRGTGIGIVIDNFGMAFLKGGKTMSGARLPEHSGARIDYVLPVAQQRGGDEDQPSCGS